MEQSRQAQMNNYKAFGRRPGNRNLTVEKAKDKKGTLKRLIAYFAAEKAMIIGLLAAVIVVVICSVYAPKLQSNAIDIIDQDKCGIKPEYRKEDERRFIQAHS